MNKQEELLTITMEECGELIQACSKVMRTEGKDLYYWNLLAEEVGDVMTMVDLLIQHGYVTPREIEARKVFKESKLKRWSNLYE